MSEAETKSTLSIIIPNYNHAQYLEDAVIRACEQTRRVDEVIVVDDGSTDNSVEIVKTLLPKYSNLQLIESGKNNGSLVALYKGLDVATSKYVASIAADDILKPDFVKKSMAALERNPEAGLCFSNFAVLHDDTNEIKEHAYDPQMKGIFDTLKYPEFLTPELFRKQLESGVIWMTGNSVIFKRELLEECGGFQKSIQWHADWLVYQIIALRHGACVIPETLAILRSISDSYSAKGIKDPKLQGAVIQSIMDFVRQPQFRDIYQAFLNYPIIISPLGDMAISTLWKRPRDWRLFIHYAFTLVRFTSGYGLPNRRSILYWPMSVLGLRWDPDYAPPLKQLTKPTFGIIWTNYNDAKFLRISLGAMISQTRKLDEIVIVDDGSTDDSIAVIEEFQKKAPYIRLIKNEQNMGVMYSINRALNESSCDFINWAASDDKVLPKFVEKSAGVLERNPQAVICMSELATFEDEAGEINFKRNDSFVFDLSLAPDFMTPKQADAWLSSHILWVSGNTTFIRRQLILAMGGYLNQFEWHADWFVGMVLSVRYGICVVPEVLAAMRVKPGSYSDVGIANTIKQNSVISSLMLAINHPNYWDIGDAVRKHPVLLSPLSDHNIIQALYKMPRFWALMVRYIWWRIKYNAKINNVNLMFYIADLVIRKTTPEVIYRVFIIIFRNPLKLLHAIIFMSDHAKKHGLSVSEYLKINIIDKLAFTKPREDVDHKKPED